MAATLLEYLETRGIPIKLINTHSLRCGGANALALSGFSDTQIQKMGRWRGATFKEYIREQLACYSEEMTTKMKHNFKFVYVHGNAYHNVTSTCVLSEYDWASVFSVDDTMGYPLVCFSSQTPHNTTPSTE
jgi:hypothetical protein